MSFVISTICEVFFQSVASNRVFAGNTHCATALAGCADLTSFQTAVATASLLPKDLYVLDVTIASRSKSVPHKRGGVDHPERQTNWYLVGVAAAILARNLLISARRRSRVGPSPRFCLIHATCASRRDSFWRFFSTSIIASPRSCAAPRCRRRCTAA